MSDAHVCGHSMGGMVAQHLASHHPERVAKLVLADTSYGTRSTRTEALMTHLAMPFVNMMPVKMQAKFYADQLGKQSPATAVYVQEEIGAHASDKQNYSAIWKAVTDFDGYAQLASITCETLVLAAQLNKQTHRQAEVMRERIPNAKVVYIKDAGHMLNWDNAEQFNQVLTEFVG